MAYTSLDYALLKEDVNAEVTAKDLDRLSPAQLAIAVGRDDLDFTTRLRAALDFSDRRQTFFVSGARDDPSGGLFTVDLEYTLPDHPETYTPTMLLLMPFNRLFDSDALVQEAAARFRHLALTHQARPPTPAIPSVPPSRIATPVLDLTLTSCDEPASHVELLGKSEALDETDSTLASGARTPDPASHSDEFALPAAVVRLSVKDSNPQEVDIVDVLIESEMMTVSQEGFDLLVVHADKVEEFSWSESSAGGCSMTMTVSEALIVGEGDVETAVQQSEVELQLDESTYGTPGFPRAFRRLRAWAGADEHRTSRRLRLVPSS
ncbi:hypothetical protein JCM10908_003431 [Rhodotorula pacifica]|uniref:uncharacterized protein n=1 Tax=Rhodotorula pacifica TaxID=1495444 RepID=UPI00316CB660